MERFSALIIVSLALIIFSCGDNALNLIEEKSSIDIRVWVDPGVNPPESRVSNRLTSYNRLVVNVNSDSNSISDTTELDGKENLHFLLFENLKSGVMQRVTLYTLNELNDTIHTPVSDSITLLPGENSIFTFELYPAKGSMYLIIDKFSDSIDSVFFSFTTASDTFSVREKKGTKFYATLDNIKFGLTGTIKVVGVDNLGNVVTSWELEDYTFTKDNTTLEADFLNVGSSEVSVTIKVPGNTTIWGTMDNTVASEKEDPSVDSILYISEFMCSAGSGSSSLEFVEIYNASTTFDSLFFDTLLLEIKGIDRVIKGVAIKKNGFFVVGAEGITEPEKWSVDQIANIDMVGTKDWIRLRNSSGKLLDKLFYVEDNKDLGWPNAASKKSIVLDSLPKSPIYNNYGSNWIEAVSAIHADYPEYFGTPGRAGM